MYITGSTLQNLEQEKGWEIGDGQFTNELKSEGLTQVRDAYNIQNKS